MTWLKLITKLLSNNKIRRSNYFSMNVSILFPYLFFFFEKDLDLNVVEKQIVCKGGKFQQNIVHFIFNNCIKMYITKNIISLFPMACSLSDMFGIVWYQKSNMPLGWSWNISLSLLCCKILEISYIRVPYFFIWWTSLALMVWHNQAKSRWKPLYSQTPHYKSFATARFVLFQVTKRLPGENVIWTN